jgi:hypothetical protein
MRVAVVVAMSSAGCGSWLDVGDFDDTSSGSTTAPGEDGDGASASATASPTGADDAGDPLTEGGTIVSDDGTSDANESSSSGEPPLGPPCDPLLQNCGAMQTCVWGDDTFRCFDLGADAEIGELCDATNDCVVGSQCIVPEDIGCDEGDPGCCASFCDLTDGDAGCAPDTVCVPWFDGDPPPGLEDVGTCRLEKGSEDPAECDGIAQDCEPGQTCVPVDNFECLPTGNRDLGDSCVEISDCSPGLVCVPWDSLPDCDEADVSCCTSLCMLDSGGPCQAGTTCNELPGAPLPDNENAGYCTI